MPFSFKCLDILLVFSVVASQPSVESCLNSALLEDYSYQTIRQLRLIVVNYSLKNPSPCTCFFVLIIMIINAIQTVYMQLVDLSIMGALRCVLLCTLVGGVKRLRAFDISAGNWFILT